MYEQEKTYEEAVAKAEETLTPEKFDIFEFTETGVVVPREKISIVLNIAAARKFIAVHKKVKEQGEGADSALLAELEKLRETVEGSTLLVHLKGLTEGEIEDVRTVARKNLGLSEKPTQKEINDQELNGVDNDLSEEVNFQMVADSIEGFTYPGGQEENRTVTAEELRKLVRKWGAEAFARLFIAASQLTFSTELSSELSDAGFPLRGADLAEQLSVLADGEDGSEPESPSDGTDSETA